MKVWFVLKHDVSLTDRAEIYKQPIFYSMGHFSKFVPEGSVRIEARMLSLAVEAVAFKRPDQRIAVVLLNGHVWLHSLKCGIVKVNLYSNLRVCHESSCESMSEFYLSSKAFVVCCRSAT